MTICREIDLNAPLTTEQRSMLENLKTRAVQPDEECPELTAKQLNHLVKVSEQRLAPQPRRNQR